MTSGTSRRLRVLLPREEAGKVVKNLWKGLPYRDKTLKIDNLPRELWGTFLVKGPDTILKKFNKVHYFASVKEDRNEPEYVIIKIEVLIGDPIFGQGALPIVARSIFLLAKHLSRKNVEVKYIWQIFGPNLIIEP